MNELGRHPQHDQAHPNYTIIKGNLRYRFWCPVHKVDLDGEPNWDRSRDPDKPGRYIDLSNVQCLFENWDGDPNQDTCGEYWEIRAEVDNVVQP